MRRGLRRAYVPGLVAVVLAAGLLGAPSARAAQVALTLDCDTLVPGGTTWSDAGFATSLTIAAPAAAPTGAPIVVSASLDDAPRSLPLALTDARVTTTSYSFSIQAAGKPEIGATAASDPGSPGPQANLGPSDRLTVPSSGDLSFQPAAPYEPGDSLKVRFVSATYTLEFADVGGVPTTATIVCRPRSGTPDPTTGAFDYSPIQVAQVALFGEPVVDPVGDCVAPCSTQQNVFAEVTPGSLSQRLVQDPANPSATQVEFGDVTTDSVGQAVGAPMNPVEVTDARGGTYGWSLTASVSDPFTAGGGGTIPASALAMGAASCTGLAGSAAVVEGPAGALGTGAHTVASVGAGVVGGAGSGGGQYVCGASLTLTVPPFQRAGTYTTTLTLTLA